MQRDIFDRGAIEALIDDGLLYTTLDELVGDDMGTIKAQIISSENACLFLARTHHLIQRCCLGALFIFLYQYLCTTKSIENVRGSDTGLPGGAVNHALTISKHMQMMMRSVGLQRYGSNKCRGDIERSYQDFESL